MVRFPVAVLLRCCLVGMCGALAWGCVTGPSGAVGVVSAGSVALPTSGGTVGSACASEDQLGCAPGSKSKVRCTSGAWVSDGACSSAETCIETKAEGAVTATACGVPPTSREQRAVLCAKATACGGQVDFDECMNPPTQAMISKQIAIVGVIGPEELLSMSLDSYAGCLSAAADCPAVKACLAGSVPLCESNSADSCIGSVARVCSGNGTYPVDCSKVGLPCSKISSGNISALFCGSAPNCSTPGTFSCSGSVAKGCVALGKSSAFEVKVDCAGLGATCNPAGHASLNQQDVCVFSGGLACDAATFVGQCSGSVATNCVNGKTLAIDCGLTLASCAPKTKSSGKVEATCTFMPNCPSSLDQDCADGMVKFCDGGSGVRGFSCAKAGLQCKGGLCQF